MIIFSSRFDTLQRIALQRRFRYKKHNTLWNRELVSKMMHLLADATMETTSYAVGWGTLAMINAGLAQSKNHSGLLWFLLSLILGPIATFLIVVLCGKLPKT